MNPMHLICLAVLSAGSLSTPARAQSPDGVTKTFHLQVVLFSTTGTLESYQFHGSAGGGGNSSLGLAASGPCRFSVNLKLSTPKDDRFLVSLATKPRAGSPVTVEPLQRDLDMSGLQPMQIELARDPESGCRYAVQLMPTVQVTDTRPQPFSPDAMHWEVFRFSNSAVIIDDARYAGRMGASGGPFVWIEMPGIGKVEFSLKEFRDSLPTGLLSDGILQIQLSDQHTITINGVSNGQEAFNQPLPGGPYTVWVRWTPSDMTFEEYSKQMLAQFDEMLRTKPEAANLPPEKIGQGRAQIMKGHIMGSGVGPIPKADVLPSQVIR